MCCNIGNDRVSRGCSEFFRTIVEDIDIDSPHLGRWHKYKRGVRFKPGLPDSIVINITLADELIRRVLNQLELSGYTQNISWLKAEPANRSFTLCSSPGYRTLTKGTVRGKSTVVHSCCPSPPNSNSAASLGDLACMEAPRRGLQQR